MAAPSRCPTPDRSYRTTDLAARSRPSLWRARGYLYDRPADLFDRWPENPHDETSAARRDGFMKVSFFETGRYLPPGAMPAEWPVRVSSLEQEGAGRNQRNREELTPTDRGPATVPMVPVSGLRNQVERLGVAIAKHLDGYPTINPLEPDGTARVASKSRDASRAGGLLAGAQTPACCRQTIGCEGAI